MTNWMMTTRLENIEESNQVGLDVVAGTVDGVTHPGLDSKVDHNVEAVLCEETLDKGASDRSLLMNVKQPSRSASPSTLSLSCFMLGS